MEPRLVLGVRETNHAIWSDATPGRHWRSYTHEEADLRSCASADRVTVERALRPAERVVLANGLVYGIARYQALAVPPDAP